MSEHDDYCHDPVNCCPPDAKAGAGPADPRGKRKLTPEEWHDVFNKSDAGGYVKLTYGTILEFEESVKAAAARAVVGQGSDALRSLRELSEKATPGPWCGDQEGYCEYVWGPEMEMIAQIRGVGAGLPREANQAFIVACVNYVRSQLSEVEHGDN